MGEINNAGEEDVKIDNTENGGDNQDASPNDAGTGGGSEGDNKPDDENASKGDEADNGNKPNSKPTPFADEEPKTRKRNIDFILERKNRKIEKLKGESGVADEEEDDDNIDPEDSKIIQKHVAKALSPFLAKQMQDEDSQEIGDFIKQNPDFAPYADKVRKFAQHPSRREMPIKALFYEVAGDDLLKIGADRVRKANAEARKTVAGGGTGAGSDAPKGAWDLTPEEFTAQQDAVRSKQRD